MEYWHVRAKNLHRLRNYDGDAMATVNGVCAIIYEKTDEALFFLLFRRNSNWKGWESLKGKCLPDESSEAAISKIVSERIKRFTVKGKLDEKRTFKAGDNDHEFTVFLVESYTNIPVNMVEEKKKHDNYIWLARGDAMERLQWPEEKTIYSLAVSKIKNEQDTV